MMMTMMRFFAEDAKNPNPTKGGRAEICYITETKTYAVIPRGTHSLSLPLSQNERT